MGAAVLIVDDAVSVRWIVGKVFQQRNFIVYEAVNGIEGLKILNSHPIDLVIVDLNMPEMNGLEFITKVKENLDYADLPIVVLTGESNAQLLNIAKEHGAAGWIIKPFNPEKFVDSIEELAPHLFQTN
ncbi:MAG: response regulator [Brevinematales bacterium]|nr:response regulator [Brevinematales bacterium]